MSSIDPHDLTAGTPISPVSDGEFCSLVRLKSYPNPAAMVVEISGDIDASDINRVSDYLDGFVHADDPLILDLSGVTYIGVAGFQVLLRFASKREEDQRKWLLLVPSAAVNVLLHVVPEHGLSAFGSLGAASRRLAAMSNTRHRTPVDRPGASRR